ncbi:hypothetical protein BHF71_03135 [Vulcanibacillus modesticaldus]|uniref:Aminoglycoside phosphotransferase domain-containing protein n=1 Tax=Vulcanibacillus modesticaldus TaxID=337097 RepID=A0A1D2YST6_9BACI|nr:phosphotransferase [Vulcanibacillus modesticaldus]OEF98029.1 hypothetical protein BHF71_03135 [Vulcanibacillus modesticaldus]
MGELFQEKIFKNYGILPNKITRFNHLLRVTSREGEWVIKGYKKPVSNIMWINYLSQELKKKGFKRISMILLTNNGLPWFNIGEQLFILMPCIKGKMANYTMETDLEKVIEVLAGFHHHGGWIGDDYFPNIYKPIYLKYLERLGRFQELYQHLINKVKKDQLDRQILVLAPTIIKLAKNSLQAIDLKQLNHLYQEAIDNHLVVHRDVASHNFIIGEQSWIIDFDLSSYEPQFLDLLQLINRVIVDWNWDLEMFVKLENTYHSYRKIRNEEKKLIRQLSLFPNDFFRESLGAYLYPNRYKKKNVLKIINKYNENLEAYLFFQKNLKDI